MIVEIDCVLRASVWSAQPLFRRLQQLFICGWPCTRQIRGSAGCRNGHVETLRFCMLQLSFGSTVCFMSVRMAQISLGWGRKTLCFGLKYLLLVACSSYPDACPAFVSNSGVQVLGTGLLPVKDSQRWRFLLTSCLWHCVGSVRLCWFNLVLLQEDEFMLIPPLHLQPVGSFNQESAHEWRFSWPVLIVIIEV